MSDLLDTRQLEIFTSLAETRSFTEAGKRLFLSQSAVSHSLRSLEAQLDRRLVDRLGRRLLLTESGDLLYRRAKEILEHMGNARIELDSLNNWDQGRLRVAASSTACQYLLPSVLREFKECFPRVRISVEPADSPDCLKLLEDNRADLALRIGMQAEDHLAERPLFTDELLFLVSPQHPWAAAGRASRGEMGDQDYLLYSKRSETFKLIMAFFEANGEALRSFIELGSIAAIKELAKINLGVAVLAPWVAAEELAAGTLVALPLGRRKLKRRWRLAWLKGRRLSINEETFMGLCEAHAENMALKGEVGRP